MKKLLDVRPGDAVSVSAQMGRGAREKPIWGRLIPPRVALALGLILLAVGMVINWKVSQWGEDFGHLFVMGKSLVLGFDIYTATDLAAVYRDMLGKPTAPPHGIFYTPSSGVAILPFTVLPAEVAKTIWLLLSFGVLLAGVNQLLRLLAPGLSLPYRVLVMGALMCTSAVRWGFFALQPAPLVFGLLCVYLVALHEKRTGVALAISVAVISLKFTLGLPFVGLALLQRRYAFVAVVAGLWIVVNGLGFARLGGLEAVSGYQSNMARFEQADQVNYPDFRAPNSMQRLDWPYILNAISPDLSRSNTLGMLLTAASAVLLFSFWRRCRSFANELPTALAFLGPLVCLSLLSVYHHHYDAIALFGPAIVYLSQYARQPARINGGLVALFVVPLVLYAGLYEVGEVQDLTDRVFGEGASAFAKLLGVVSVNVAFGASLLLLRDFVRQREASFRTAPDSAEATQPPVLNSLVSL